MKIKKQPRLTLADLFCGAGGTSTGAVEAAELLGYDVKLTAVNHWPVAIATHTANHPGARHLCTSIDDVNPRTLFAEGELDVLWASPECTHHSVARGGRPINDQSRATAWCVVRWAEAVRPGVILIENVPEFLNWGGIGADGRPMKSKKGDTFRAWKAALESLGYRVDWRILCAADYGDPTSRERLFVQAVRGKRRIMWPDPTHTKGGDNGAQGGLFARRKPWESARDRVIDWTLPSQSIYDRKRPLSPKTMERIYSGLHKFGLKQFIVPKDSGKGRVRSVDKPLQTVTCESRGIGLLEPYIVPHFGEREGQTPRAHSVNDPLPTVTGQGAGSLVEPFLVELRGSADDQLQRSAHSVKNPLGAVAANGTHHGLVEPFLVQVAHAGGGDRCRSVDQPMPTVCGNRGEHAIIEPSLLPQQSDGRLRSVNEPAPTVATAGAIALVEPYLVSYYGNGGAQSVDDPLDTVTVKDRFALVRPVVEMNGKRYLLDLRFRMLQPHELAAAQGFRSDYLFTGNKTQQVKQIGNAVPRRLARAIVHAVLNQDSDVSNLLDPPAAHADAAR